ncbi:hypothetical protein niasHT_009904 [Heterodera trifolii]|uniref:Uncharacterized protein n=2 Tax=Heterodera TaxID=34509 RepID=A0ABD2MFF1_9BILA
MMPIPSLQLLLAFLPILMLPHQLHCDAKPSKMHIRAKRDFMPPDNPGQPCGCASKYAPINCRCTSASGNSGELLCRCDRARIPPINREDSSSGNIISNRAGGPPPITAQCGGNCRMPAGEPNLFRQGAHQQQHGYGTYGYGGGGGTVPPIHSACHPICHKSCTHSCPSSRSPSTGSIDQQNNNNNFGSGGFSPSEFHHQQHNQPMPSMDSLKGNNNFNCFPSKCRANCLRACARIFDAQQRQQQQQIRENFVPSNGIENDIDVESHYQVEMGGGQTKLSSPDHGNNNNENIMATGRNGCQCSPSAANVCECQEPCYPICVDTCESNCLQQQMQQSPANQRAQCAQFCHLECQHDCAMEQQQQQRVPARKAVETTMGEGIDNVNGNNNNNWPSDDNRMMSSSGSGTQIGNPITICAHKCPRACEQACQSAAQNGEPNSNCVPTCIGLCAQSCARGIQFDAVGLTQQMAVPMPTMALVDIAGGGGAAQMPTNISINGINGGAEFEQLQHQQQQQQKLNDWGGGGEATQNYGQNDGQLAEFGNNEMSFPNAAAMAAPPLAMEEAGRQEHTVIAAAPSADGSITGEAAGGMPCAPLCQPECRPECTKRYMEERRGIDDQAQQQYEKMMKNNGMNNGRENDEGKNDGATGSGGNGQKPIGTDQQQQGQDEHKQQSTKQQRSAASSPSASFVPPHIILDDGVTATAYNDDEEGTNGTTKGRTKIGDNNLQKRPKKKQHLNRMPWLRMPNETDAWVDNRSRIPAELGHPKQQQNNTKTNEVRKKQQKTKDKASKTKQKVPNAVKNEKQLVQNGHQHNHKNDPQNSNKDDKIRRRANEFFRRRKLLFGGESKVPIKKVPKNGNEKVEKNDMLKAVKREKNGQNAKAQNANAKKLQ